MKELQKYLKQAKANGWTLDLYSLALRFGVSDAQVRAEVKKIYKHNY